MTKRTVGLLISGRVQGVGYRDFVRREAETRALTGWVRNRRDGKVEAVVSGEASIVDEFVAACRHGPPAARVADIEVEALGAAAAAAAGFTVLPTA
jgi:acylphosphatase